jgi:hypothetical protein
MHRCFPLLKNGRMLDLLSFTNVDPHNSDLAFPSRRCTGMECITLRMNDEDTTRWGSSTWLLSFRVYEVATLVQKKTSINIHDLALQRVGAGQMENGFKIR